MGVTYNGRRLSLSLRRALRPSNLLKGGVLMDILGIITMVLGILGFGWTCFNVGYRIARDIYKQKREKK